MSKEGLNEGEAGSGLGVYGKEAVKGDSWGKIRE
jgi:hypothetical protein